MIPCCSWAAVNFQDKVFEKVATVPHVRDQLYRERLSETGSGASLSRHPTQAKTDAGLQQDFFFFFFSGSSEEWRKVCFQRGRKDASSPGITRCLAGFDLKKQHKFPESTAESRVSGDVSLRFAADSWKVTVYTLLRTGGNCAAGSKTCCAWEGTLK